MPSTMRIIEGKEKTLIHTIRFNAPCLFVTTYEIIVLARLQKSFFRQIVRSGMTYYVYGCGQIIAGNTLYAFICFKVASKHTSNRRTHFV